MKKILFLLNDSLKYKKLINVLVDSNIRVNILEGYTDILINIINYFNYEDINNWGEKSFEKRYNTYSRWCGNK